jgi:site-specific DNA recombinase
MMDSIRAVLYMRVSTDEQAQRGYSIPDQQRELRAYAEREGYRVVEEVLDDGYSGASPDRPGLHRIMELAEAGAMDIVLALKRNRLFRSRLYRLMWDRDLKDLGVELRALDDTGNRFGDAMTDEFAEWEREQITERTMRGRLQKARQGKLIPVFSPGYGYRYNEDRTGLVVDEAEMQVVYRIIEEIAGGATIHRVTTGLNRDGVPGPRSVKYLRGAPRWNRVTVRNIILSDLYLPHTAAEVTEQVAPDVAATLDEKARYGILRYAKRRTTPLSGDQPIAIPVPSSGLPRDLVERARDAIRENRRSSYNGGRRWPLSGGIARCAVCGARMETSTSMGRKGKPYYYYRCNRRYGSTSMGSGFGPCENNKSVRAEDAERQVWEFAVYLTTSPLKLGELLDREIAALRERAHGYNPDRERARLERRLDEIEAERMGYVRLNARGVLSDRELYRELDRLKGERSDVERRFEAATGLLGQIENLEDLKTEMFFSYMYEKPELMEHWSPEQRQRLYHDLGLAVYMGANGVEDIKWTFSGTATTSSLLGTTNMSMC